MSEAPARRYGLHQANVQRVAQTIYADPGITRVRLNFEMIQQGMPRKSVSTCLTYLTLAGYVRIIDGGRSFGGGQSRLRWRADAPPLEDGEYYLENGEQPPREVSWAT